MRSDPTPLPAFDRARKSRAHSSAGERSLHTGEVQGSIPCAPTMFKGFRALTVFPKVASHTSVHVRIRLACVPSPSFLMEPGLFDHFRPLAVVDLELVRECGAAAAEHDAAFRLHALDDCRRLER